ncbi:hypothetical protein RE628_05515 [Paenibacillus sp. D2_2]|uniref:hypothetical protein n=1 Tax=Paenibacillus sp. D2_2 TaxID=3073092 RepID=UPI0028162487|nr:hypothetical protein [Paenibacillus sp. D2_2]WMT41905.1 hypothetical protein RE628_05515 [Paenibacillus sp. D2_2]
MNKRSVFMIAMLTALFLMLPLSAGAEEATAVKGLKAMFDKTTKKVTVEGAVMGISAVNVTLKVVDPKGEIDYVDQIKSAEDGKFSFAFTLSSSQRGTYTVYVGAENLIEPEKVTFEYKDGSTSGGDGGGGGGGSSVNSNPPASHDMLQLQADGSVKAMIETKLDQDGVTAVGVISEQDLQKGVAKAKADQEGKKRVIIEPKEQKERRNMPLIFLYRTYPIIQN